MDKVIHRGAPLLKSYLQLKNNIENEGYKNISMRKIGLI